MEGWVSIERSLIDHWIWEKKRPKSRFEAWVYLIINANFQSQKVPIGNTIIECERGQLIQSQETLAKAWKWNKSAVRRFLELLKNDSMIVIENVLKTTRITICNYDKYQNIGINYESKVNQFRINSESILTPNNNENNVNNENNALKEKRKKEKYQALEKITTTAKKLEKEIMWPFDSEKFKEAWGFWIQYRTERKMSSYKPTGLQMCLKKLAQDSEGNEEIAIKMIENSIANNWQGIFPLKQNLQNGTVKPKFNAAAVQSAIFGDR